MVAWVPLGHATRGCDRLVHPLTPPFRLYNPLDKKTLGPNSFPENILQAAAIDVMRHGVDVISLSSWEPQEEGMMSTAPNFPSVRNQGMSNPGKSQTQEGDAC
jgi:hypothetical protein